MFDIYEIRVLLITIYKKYERFILPIFKFIVSLILFIKLNNFLNYNEAINNAIFNTILSLIVTFIPGNWLVIILFFLITSHLLFVSLEVSAIVVSVMLVIMLMYIRIFPKLGYYIVAVPLFYSIGIPFAIPIFAGLFSGPVAIIPISIGVVIYYFSGYLSSIIELQSNSIADLPNTLINMYQLIVNTLLTDKAMILSLIIFIIVTLITYFIIQFEIDYVWYIAIVTSGVVNIIAFILGKILLNADINTIGLIIGSIFSIILVSAVQFLRICLDYSRAEKVQFEDEDYYYYVKTVPKIKISKTEKKIKRIK